MDLKKYKTILEGEKEKLIKEIAYYSNEDPYIDKYRSSETLDDSVTEIEGHDRLISTKADLETLLKNVEDALKRIEDKNFGLCENCKNIISEERLKVIPAAALCKSCQEKKNKA